MSSVVFVLFFIYPHMESKLPYNISSQYVSTHADIS